MRQLPIDVRGWEPAMALDGGIDGLDFYRLIIEQAPRVLTDGGSVLVEIGADLGPEVCGLFAASGRYHDCEVHVDYSQRPRVVSARMIPVRGASANGNQSG
jgi:release factor glutamine methyltransferase